MSRYIEKHAPCLFRCQFPTIIDKSGIGNRLNSIIRCPHLPTLAKFGIGKLIFTSNRCPHPLSLENPASKMKFLQSFDARTRYSWKIQHRKLNQPSNSMHTPQIPLPDIKFLLLHNTKSSQRKKSSQSRKNPNIKKENPTSPARFSHYFYIYIDFLSAISAIFASFSRVSPWTRL